MWKTRVYRFYHTRNRLGERLWDIDRVRLAVELGYITEENFKDITGKSYEAN